MMKSYYTPSENKIEQMEYVKSIIETRSNLKNLNVSFDEDSLIVICQKESILPLINFLKENLRCLFQQLTDITAVDYPEDKERFEVIYILLSLEHNLRIRIKTRVKENDILESITYYYTNADWLEREVWDMFGIYFNNHPDLRRLLTDYGFDGHPLRKDFPLTGFMEMVFDSASQKVIYKPIELDQVHRDFSKQNVWMDEIEKDTFNYLKKNGND